MPHPPSLNSHLHGLYVITSGRQQTPAQLVTEVEQALIGGAQIVQYRNKSHDTDLRKQQALALRALCQNHGTLFIVNDDAELAKQVHADGVHLGQDDASIISARQLLGAQALIGITCYNQLDNAIRAEQAGADYVAFGSFFPSPNKPQAVMATLPLLQQARQTLSIPIAAIGGITIDNGARLITAGATMLAVISGVFAQTERKSALGIAAAARGYVRLFDNTRF